MQEVDKLGERARNLQDFNSSVAEKILAELNEYQLTMTNWSSPNLQEWCSIGKDRIKSIKKYILDHKFQVTDLFDVEILESPEIPELDEDNMEEEDFVSDSEE